MAKRGKSLRSKVPGAERNGVGNLKVGAIKAGPAINPPPAGTKDGVMAVQNVAE
jgi:hypothetical protein